MASLGNLMMMRLAVLATGIVMAPHAALKGLTSHPMSHIMHASSAMVGVGSTQMNIKPDQALASCTL
jgi:hypothetical protein